MLTHQQELDVQPKPVVPWSFKRIISPDILLSVSKVFTTPIEVCLGILVIGEVIDVLVGRAPDKYISLLTGVFLIVTVVERHFDRKISAQTDKLKK